MHSRMPHSHRLVRWWLDQCMKSEKTDLESSRTEIVAEGLT